MNDYLEFKLQMKTIDLKNELFRLQSQIAEAIDFLDEHGTATTIAPERAMQLIEEQKKLLVKVAKTNGKNTAIKVATEAVK